MKQVVLLILEQGGRVFFAKRSKYRISMADKWALPSETVEAGETPEAVAIRCAQEDLGIIIEKVAIIGRCHYKDKNEDKLLFFVRPGFIEKEPAIQSDKLTKPQWMTFEEFFKKYPDSKIGHGLMYLRKHPKLWNKKIA